MTKEVKIGLLVGLGFMIVMGILMSDHIQSSTEPPQAKLADAGKTAEQAVKTLGSSNVAPVTVVTPANVTPQQPVPTANDLNPRPQVPTQIVTIGPGTQQQPPITIVQDRPQTSAPTNVQPSTPTPPTTPVAINNHQTAGADAPDVAPSPAGGLREVARQAGEELFPLGPGDSIASSMTIGKVHKAETGDTLSRLAARYLGANTKSNRDLIIKANPTLRDNPDRIIVGKSYTIPTTDAQAQLPQAHAVGVGVQSSPPTIASATEPPTTPAGAEYWYTVKQGDSLWRIATEQCGNPGAVAAIKELNKDTLKGTEVVKVDMKLRLPAHPVASVN